MREMFVVGRLVVSSERGRLRVDMLVLVGWVMLGVVMGVVVEENVLGDQSGRSCA